MDDVGDDPRLERGLALFNRRDYAEAADEFEELFFEAVGDEVEFVRALMQVAVGVHHIERGQPHAAIERLDEGLLAIADVTNARGIDFERLAEDVRGLITALRSGAKVTWPSVTRSDPESSKFESRIQN